jgi:eukaryotic-like serine/threonine-protein kinase
MPGKVTLTVTAGPIRGRSFEFTEHDTFLFGRAADCHAELPSGDTSASRHHFLLEANPPKARLRDLGSLNGTHVNGVRHGGRGRKESPEQGALRDFAQVDLAPGDEIRVGATVFSVAIESPMGPTIRASENPTDRFVPTPTARLSAQELPGSMAGYELGRVLGRGGMGAVYLARRHSDGAEVAVKVMLPQVVVDPSARDAFLREIEITRSLRHPRIVEVFDFGFDGEGFFFAMEYCPGGSALSLMRAQGGRVDLPTGLRIARDVLDGLAFAHDGGFVHRDVKPDNILLAADGSARLTDFGLAKSFQQAGLSGMTATGTVAGTPYFMPREQLTSFRQLRPASDVWSLGATLCFLLTGQHVRRFVKGKDPIAVILRGGIVPMRDRSPDLPPALVQVLDKAIADDVKERYATAGEMQQALLAVVGS